MPTSVSSLPLELALFFYLGACVLYMFWFVLNKKRIGQAASCCVGAASILLGYYIYNRWSTGGQPPFAGKFESLITFAWCIGVVYLILEWFIKMRHAGAGVSLIAALMLASTWLLDNSIQPLMPALQDNFWLTTHVLLCFLGYAGFAVAFVLAVLHLLSSP
ncbi:MAG: cytochrome c biogenesis protein CcsA, partial [Planctomycetota bacterium]